MQVTVSLALWKPLCLELQIEKLLPILSFGTQNSSALEL
jgi:hypothetical protein